MNTDQTQIIIKRLERINSIMLTEAKTAMRPNLKQRLEEQQALLDVLKREMQKDAAERLRLKLEGVTDKHERYEITYAHCIWEFEQMHYRKGKRDPLPAGPRRPTTQAPSMVIAAEKSRQHSINQVNRLFSLIKHDQRITASEAAELLGESVPRTSSYLKKMWQADKIYRVRDLVEIEGCTKPQWRWVFSKQPIKPLNNCFEDDE